MSLEATTASVKAKAEAADQLNASIKFVFSDQDGVVYIDGTTDPNAVSNEDKDADCTVKMTFEDFNQVLSGDLNPMGAFMGGKLKVDGDMSVAMKLVNLF